jgi:ribosomal peptide maturation radical SAM protein 1
MPSTPLPDVITNRPAESERVRAGQSGRRVLLICPPFQYDTLSSLSTAQLATFLRDQGTDCAEAYLHFELVRLVGRDRYRTTTSGPGGRLGELLFAEGLHGLLSDAETQRALAKLFGSPAERRSLLDELGGRCLARVDRERPDIVGITTSCHQLLAALWMARIIKRRYPTVTVVLGGSACSEPMGQRILDAYPQVDFVVSGFGEQPLLALSCGVLPAERFIRSHEPVDLDSMSVPDYGPFLREAQDHGHDPRLMLTFQSSRGCWWGQKKHCTFCGLNGIEMAYVAKSSERVVREIRTLWERHGRNLFATDAIMSREHLRHVLPELARFESRPKLFYELKTNMTQAEVAALGRANVLGQLGVESLSTRLLKLLRKGVTAIRNLAVLKWCRERHITVAWNQLCAIPGETTEDYDEQISLMSKIPHLPPPDETLPVGIVRFSPYFDDYREFGWTEIEPLPEYRLMHPHLDEAALRDITYHFRGVGGVSPAAYFDRFDSAVRQWQRRNRQGEGLFLDPVQGLVRNEPEVGRRLLVHDVVRRVLDCTHDVASISRVLSHAGCERSVLEQMAEHGLLYIEDNQVLNLTVRTQVPDAVD